MYNTSHPASKEHPEMFPNRLAVFENVGKLKFVKVSYITESVESLCRDGYKVAPNPCNNDLCNPYSYICCVR